MRTTVRMVLVLVACAALGGCGGGDDGSEAAPPADPSGSSTVTSVPSPSESSSASVEPATGKEYTVGPVTFRAPEDYDVGQRSGQVIALNGPSMQGFGVAAQTSSGTLTFEDLASDASIVFGAKKPQRVADVEVGGVTFYHLVGEGGYGYTEQLGALHEGYILRFTFSDFQGKRELKKWMEPVLASVTLG